MNQLRFVFGAFLSAMLLVACSSNNTELIPSQQSSRFSAPTRAVGDSILPSSSYHVLHRFAGGPDDGDWPEAALIDVNGTLYGTTGGGGKHGYGTVYSISTSGVEKVLYSFAGGSDGAGPSSGPLLNVNGTLYGSTGGGGKHGYGTVYRISTSGVEKVLYSFAGGSDGAGPNSGLLNVNGILYGTTGSGGGLGCDMFGGCGTVFRISTSGAEKVLHRFDASDGADPNADLINVKGTLYGTTFQGGLGLDNTYGIVYRISTSGAEKVLHRFKAGSDGYSPSAGLINEKGTLYGTTDSGGGSKCYGHGCGIVYRISTSGVEKVLYSFKGGSDGEGGGGLLNVNGTLYGATGGGGSIGCGTVYFHCGTIFRISTGGAERVLYRFKGGSDGRAPEAALLNVGGTLYGTTAWGGGSGCSNHGCGIVFAFTP